MRPLELPGQQSNLVMSPRPERNPVSKCKMESNREGHPALTSGLHIYPCTPRAHVHTKGEKPNTKSAGPRMGDVCS